jgi:hypothetical protein
MSLRNIVAAPSSVHDDRECGVLGAGDEPLRAIDHVVVAIALAVVCSIDGRPRRRAGFAHRENRSGVAGDERREPARLVRARRDHLQQVDVAFVGCVDVGCHRPGCEYPASSNTTALAAWDRPRPPTRCLREA